MNKTKPTVFFVILAAAVVFTAAACYPASEEATGGAGAVSTTAAVVPRPDPDSISAASEKVYFEENSLTGDKLRDAVHGYRGGAMPVATVNADGTPNLAFVGPDMIRDDAVMIGLWDNQTKENILRRKYAVAGVYLYDPDRGITESRGARLVLELIEDPETIDELRSLVPDAPDDVVFMKVLRVLPVG